MSLLPSLLAAAGAAALLVLVSAFRLARAPLVPATSAAISGLALGAALSVFAGLWHWAYPLAVVVAALACAAAREHLRERVLEASLCGAVMSSWGLSVLTLEGSSRLPSPLLWSLAGAAGGAAWGALRAPLPRILLIITVAAAFLVADSSGLAGISVGVEPLAPLVVVSALALGAFAIELWQATRLRALLAEEAGWGILDDHLTARLVAPFRRFAAPPGFDRQLWLEMVRVSSRLGERRIRQRNMPPSAARVQQIEIIRLRTRLMELQSLHQGTHAHARAMELE